MAGAGSLLTGQQQVALEAMGIDVWLPRVEFAAVPTFPVPPAPVTPSAADDWGTLEHEALACTKCVLHRTRTRVVFGVGDRRARWLVIGEAPGADEDRLGEPFVGRAGQLLNEMLCAAGLDREQVYIANILKCRPPENRDPKPEESESCVGYLQRQIALVQPGLLLAVGRIAAQNLLRVDTPLSSLRGRVHRYGPAGIPLVVTYHPAYLLRSPGQKRKAWEDLCLAMATVPPLRSPAPARAAIDER
jgi:DNA polymerase